MKKYFAKHIQKTKIEGIREMFDFYNPAHTEGLKYLDAIEGKKLFLCSRDIQAGNKFTQTGIDMLHPTARFTCIDRFEKNGDILVKDDEDRHFMILNKDYPDKVLCYKVIGEISSDALWVTEGMEFDEEEIKNWCSGNSEGLTIFCSMCENVQSWKDCKKHIIKIKDECGHFH